MRIIYSCIKKKLKINIYVNKTGADLLLEVGSGKQMIERKWMGNKFGHTHMAYLALWMLHSIVVVV